MHQRFATADDLRGWWSGAGPVPSRRMGLQKRVSYVWEQYNEGEHAQDEREVIEVRDGE